LEKYGKLVPYVFEFHWYVRSKAHNDIKHMAAGYSLSKAINRKATSVPEPHNI
jgi:hypothetical protein